MEIEDFSLSLCELNNAIDKYLVAKRTMDFLKLNRRSITIPDECMDFIEDVIYEKLKAYEKQIVEYAVKLTQQKQE